MSGRSSVETPLPALRDSDRSRSAVGRFARLAQDLVGRQDEVERVAEGWAGAPGERAGGRTELLAIETMRTLALFCVASLGKREEPVESEEVARLALALRRIEGADILRVEREHTLANAAARAGGAAQKAGLSTETVAAIRGAIEGEFQR